MLTQNLACTEWLDQNRPTFERFCQEFEAANQKPASMTLEQLAKIGHAATGLISTHKAALNRGMTSSDVPVGRWWRQSSRPT